MIVWTGKCYVDNRSAKEAEALEKQALEKGEVLPTEARFDSNCITPGSLYFLLPFQFCNNYANQLNIFVVFLAFSDKLIY